MSEDGLKVVIQGSERNGYTLSLLDPTGNSKTTKVPCPNEDFPWVEHLASKMLREERATRALSSVPITKTVTE